MLAYGAVAAEDPEALLGQVLLILQDLFRFIAAAGFQSLSLIHISATTPAAVWQASRLWMTPMT